MKQRFALALFALSLAACGGGGGGSPTVTPTQAPAQAPTQAPSVSGDMLAVSQNKGWNYHGTLQGTAVTITLYADPISNGVTPIVALAAVGTLSDATAGQKIAAATVSSSTTGYDVTGYTLYNTDGSVYSSGALPSGSELVPATLTLGQTFTPYAGMTATVTTVGSVPGVSGCPVAASGATVTYAFQGQSYQVSYVPGCGLTQFVGNHGETFTLSSVGTYQLGTLGDVRRMTSLTLFDTVKSVFHVVALGQRWHSALAGMLPAH